MLKDDRLAQRVYSCASGDADALKALLEYDPYLDKSLSEEQLAKLKSDDEANVIFARQDYILKDGASAGLDRDRYYLYLSANDDFMGKAEKKLKARIASVERVEPDTEAQMIADIETERRESEQGIGSIFG